MFINNTKKQSNKKCGESFSESKQKIKDYSKLCIKADDPNMSFTKFIKHLPEYPICVYVSRLKKQQLFTFRYDDNRWENKIDLRISSVIFCFTAYKSETWQLLTFKIYF